jgi:hypothetical protein
MRQSPVQFHSRANVSTHMYSITSAIFRKEFFSCDQYVAICDGKIVFLTVHDVVARITSIYELFLVHILRMRQP